MVMWEEQQMSAKLQINLANLKFNIDRIKEKLYANQELLVMVKADAYGAGLVEVTKFLEKQGVKNFGVAYLNEAKMLRKAGIKGKIIVFSGILPNEICEAINVDAVYSISSIEMLEQLNSKNNGKKVTVEIAIDTGMTRLGFDKSELTLLADKLNEMKNICVDGIYTHFSSADVKEKESITFNQIKLFEECIDILEGKGIIIPNKHICNSAGILRYNSDKYNIVRLGISAYGYYADSSMKDDVRLKPIFKLTAPVCNLRVVGENRAVSYNGTYVTDKETKIAVLQIGYADGLTRALSNKLKVNINGNDVPIIGNICMDTCMVDVTGLDVNIGDEAVIFDYESEKLEEIACITNTIHYEVITNIGKRVGREYIM